MPPKKQLHNLLYVTSQKSLCRSGPVVPPRRTLFSSTTITAAASLPSAEETEEAGAADYDPVEGCDEKAHVPPVPQTEPFSQNLSINTGFPNRLDNITINPGLPANHNNMTFHNGYTARPYECVTSYLPSYISKEEEEVYRYPNIGKRNTGAVSQRREEEEEENPLFFSDDEDENERQATSPEDPKTIAPCRRLLLHFQEKALAEKKQKSIFLSAKKVPRKRPRETRQYIEKMQERRFFYRNWLDKALLRHSFSHTLHRRHIFHQPRLPTLLFGNTFQAMLMETSTTEGDNQDIQRRTEEVAQLMQFVMGEGGGSATQITPNRALVLYHSLRYHAAQQCGILRGREETEKRG